MTTFPPGLSRAGGPLTLLREATNEQHRQLEDALHLMRPGFSRTDYMRLLQRFYGFWRPWEAAAARVLLPDFSLFFAPRRRAGWILSDLVQMGLSISEVEGLPTAPRLPALRSVAEALGSMYVTEGSTLGGQLLSRHFVEDTGIPAAACRFFSGYRSETGSMWKRFGAELEKRPQKEYPELAAAARDTFTCLREWLPFT